MSTISLNTEIVLFLSNFNYVDGLAAHPGGGGVEILLVASCYGNWDKLRPDESLGSYADFTFTGTYIAYICCFTLLALVVTMR